MMHLPRDAFRSVKSRTAIIEQWLADNPTADPELRAQALNAAGVKEQIDVLGKIMKAQQ
jgi:hypothetical protein